MKQFVVLAGLFVVSAAVYPASVMGANVKEGEKVFNSICNTCHGDQGTTDIPGIPVFSRGERMNKSDAQLKSSIKTGVNNPNNPAGMTMPAYGGGPALNDSQVADVIAYIRTLKKK